MPYFPTITESYTTQQVTEIFKGYNHNLKIDDGEFYDMKNLSSANYPVLAPRPQRGVYASPANAQGLIAKDTLCYVDGRNFVMDGYTIDLGLSTNAKDCPKRLVSMGAYVIILPDKMYVNTASPAAFGGIGESGMGTYQGHHSFLAFSHPKRILTTPTWLDIPIRYQPYTKLKDWLIRLVTR